MALGLPLGDWSEAPSLSVIHRRARRPHPAAKQLVQLGHALLETRPGIDRSRMGLALGTVSGCAAADLAFFEQCQDRGVALGSPSTFVYTLPTAGLGEMAIALGIRGGLETVTASNKLAAVEDAFAKVARGTWNSALCGTYELPRTVEGKQGFADLPEHLALFLVEPTDKPAPPLTGLADGLELAAWLAGKASAAASLL
ncbi:MAG: hypothetical protein ACT4TC_10705 [Myxococcaceae bacterium]